MLLHPGRSSRCSWELGSQVAKPPRHLLDLTRDERRAAVVDLGLPAYRADQVSIHLLRHLSDDPDSWTDIPDEAKDKLTTLLPPLLNPIRTITCDDGNTLKTAWRLHDGAIVESVVMRYPKRTTICISSQAGCGMGCPFCATGQQGLTRNLSTAEIVEQVRLARQAQERITNVVFMGMGEPLANYGAVLGALQTLTKPAPEGLGMSARGITVSTVGLVPRIRDLAESGLPVTLALSLHAPDDALRNELVPINLRWPVAEVLAAAWDYAEHTHRRVSIEYALIKDINDQRWRAELLGEQLAGHLAHVNLIPLNPTPGSRWTASEPEVQDAFVAALRRAGVPVTVRDTRGREIDGACGQLAAALIK
jgi:23S rRNA (adenine2503-C2)-methyltransferase